MLLGIIIIDDFFALKIIKKHINIFINAKNLRPKKHQDMTTREIKN